MHRLLVHLVDFIYGQDVSNSKTEGKGGKITMSDVTAAISVSFFFFLVGEEEEMHHCT